MEAATEPLPSLEPTKSASKKGVDPDDSARVINQQYSMLEQMGRPQPHRVRNHHVKDLIKFKFRLICDEPKKPVDSSRNRASGGLDTTLRQLNTPRPPTRKAPENSPSGHTQGDGA